MQLPGLRRSFLRRYLYDQGVDERAKAISEAVEAIAAIGDPEARAKAATEALQVLPDANAKLSRLRREAIKALRAAGRSYREIGRAIGIDFTRVKQIEDGLPSGNSARGRLGRRADESGEAG